MMTLKIKHSFRYFAAIGIALLTLSSAQAKNYIIASGESGGVYYPLAGAISYYAKDPNNQIVVRSTGGSQENLQLLVDGEVDLAIIQSDVILKKLTANPDLKDKLKIIKPLYKEAVSILISPTSRIRSIQDIKGKRVNIGLKASGSHQSADEISHNLSWKRLARSRASL